MHQEERPLVGWSPVADSPEILETIKKNKKSSLGWALALTLLFPVGFLIAGVVSDEVPLKEALIIGCGLGLFILAINLWRFAGMKRRGWDGAVVKKMEKRRYKQGASYSRKQSRVYSPNSFHAIISYFGSSIPSNSFFSKPTPAEKRPHRTALFQRHPNACLSFSRQKPGFA
jgi:hypothetical protein